MWSSKEEGNQDRQDNWKDKIAFSCDKENHGEAGFPRGGMIRCSVGYRFVVLTRHKETANVKDAQF